jgi:uncharacterized membrane protein YkvA (DUF1232 family)
MVVLVFIVAVLALAVLLSFLGLAAERQPDVRGALRRIEPLSHPQRGRLGVWVAKDPRVPALVRYLPLTAFIYWIIPFDFIPDPLPRIGRFDDRVALALACWCVVRLARVPLHEHLTRIEYLREVEEARLDDSPPEEHFRRVPGPTGDEP